MTAKETLFGFRGRIARYTFFICSLAAGPLHAIGLFGFLIAAFGGTVIGAIMLAAGGVGLWINLALAVKRLHDIGQSGLHVVWIAVLLFSPGWFAATDLGWVLVAAAMATVAWLLLTPGQGDANAYGPVPA